MPPRSHAAASLHARGFKVGLVKPRAGRRTWRGGRLTAVRTRLAVPDGSWQGVSMATIPAADIERRVAEDLGLDVVIEEDGDAVVVSGMLDDEEARASVLDIVSELAGDRRVDDNLELGAVLPELIG